MTVEGEWVERSDISGSAVCFCRGNVRRARWLGVEKNEVSVPCSGGVGVPVAIRPSPISFDGRPYHKGLTVLLDRAIHRYKSG